MRLPPFQTAPRGARRRRAALSARGRRPPGRGGLLAGDDAGGAARLPAPARRREPARLAVDGSPITRRSTTPSRAPSADRRWPSCRSAAASPSAEPEPGPVDGGAPAARKAAGRGHAAFRRRPRLPRHRRLIDCSEAAARQNVRAGLAAVRKEWAHAGSELTSCRAGRSTRGSSDVAYARADAPFGPLTVAATDRGTGAGGVRVGVAGRRARRSWPTGSRRGCWRRRRGWTGFAASWTSTSRAGARSSRRRSTGGSRTGSCCERGRPAMPSPTGRYAHTPSLPRPPAARAPIRAAGNAMARNPIPIVVPCHRVLRTGGESRRLRRRAGREALAARPGGRPRAAAHPGHRRLRGRPRRRVNRGSRWRTSSRS